jgi:hypothetical protein
MSGTQVITTLLINAAAVTAVAPATRIKAGVLPLNTAIPAISVSQISSNPVNLIRLNEANRMHMERVQVTAFHTTYPGLKSLMKLVLAACPSQRGTINTVVVDSIAPQSEGPEFYDHEAGIYSCSRDFMVRYTE